MSTNLSYTSPQPAGAIVALIMVFAVIIPAAGGSQKGQQPADSADALFESGVSSLKANKYQEAEEAFRKVAAMEPANSRGMVWVASVYVAQKRYDEAIQILQVEAAKNPGVGPHVAIGNIATQAAKYDLALEEYHWALNHTGGRSKDAGELCFVIGQLYLRKGDVDRSIIFLRRAKEISPGNALVSVRLADALSSAGQKDEAELEYRAALNAEPNNPGVLNNLAFFLAERGHDLDAALKYAQRASALMPDSVAISDTLGWVYLKNNMADEAVGILRGVVQKEPTRSILRYHLAEALEQKGDHAAAIEELKTALKSNPTKDEEQQIKDLLEKFAK